LPRSVREIIHTADHQHRQSWPAAIGRRSGLHNIPLFTTSLDLCVGDYLRRHHLAAWFIPKGKAFLAVREDEIAAAAMGVNTTYYKGAAFMIGAFFAVSPVDCRERDGNLDPESYRSCARLRS